VKNLNDSQILKTGTTTVGLVCKDCVILAADTRATAGSLIVNNDVDKVLEITPHMALTMAGNVSSIQMLVKYLKSELELRKIQLGRDSTVKETVTLLSTWVYGLIRKPAMMPEVAHLLFAGFDKHGFHLYDIFPDGSLTKEQNYVSSGSGSVYAYGVLENQYKSEMSQEDGIALAEKCIDAAIQRDVASGNGMNIFLINKDGARKIMSKRVNTHLQ